MTSERADGTGKLVRILVIDDYEPWHTFVSSTLRKQPELEIIGQAFDGLDAVQQAQNLQPDVILLDIGLPSLHGIEAARRIREITPASSILFVSANRSVEVAQAAMNAGADGYVVKSEAGTELLSGIRAVLEGKQFISAILAIHFQV